MFREILKYFNSSTVILNCIHILCKICCGPYQLCTLSKGCVLKLWVLVNNEFTISTDSKVSTSGRELDALRECFWMSEFFHHRLEFLSIFEFFLNEFKINSLYFTLFNPYHLPIVITYHGNLLAYLYYNSGLIKSKGYIVRFRQGMNRPYSL